MNEERHLTAPTPIGVVFGPFDPNTRDILTYLLTYENTIQSTFEFRILECPPDDELVDQLQANPSPDHEEAEGLVPRFVSRAKKHNDDRADAYSLTSEPIKKLILVSHTRLSDNYYYIGDATWALIALGGWDTEFAPPSIVEYYLTIITVAAIDGVVRGIDRHHDTRGCVFDFNATLASTRLSALSGHICQSCKAKITEAATAKTAHDAKILLERQWLGTSTSPSDVAITVKKLGYDLFHASGIRPTFKERCLVVLEQDGLKNLLNVTFQLLLAAALVIIGLKK